jgi:hypothetical protein
LQVSTTFTQLNGVSLFSELYIESTAVCFLFWAQVAGSAEVAELKQQVQQAASNAAILSQYHDKLFNTLGAEFVLAVKHIAALEVCLMEPFQFCLRFTSLCGERVTHVLFCHSHLVPSLSLHLPLYRWQNVIISAGDTPPARPDFVHHDTDAPSLPPHMQYMVNEHAATIVAHAAERLERRRQSGDSKEEDSDEDHGDEAILLQLEQQQHEMNAAVFQHQQQQFMQRQMMQQHMMAQHIMQRQQQQFGGVKGDDAEDDEDDEAELASEDELEETSQTDF